MPRRGLDHPDEHLVLGLGRREGAEVVLAGEDPCGRVERGAVERARIPPAPASLERRTLAAPVQPVAIAARLGGVARVKVRLRLLGGDHCDVVGQFGVDRLGHARRRRPALDLR